jgi:tight adherence protein C
MGINIFSTSPTDSGIALALGACTLIAGGTILIISALRARRALTNKRAEIIGRSSASIREASKSAGDAAGAFLMRRSAETPVDREVIRLFEKIGIPRHHAQLVFLGLRVAALSSLSLLALMLGPTLPLISAAPVLSFVVAAMAGIFGWFLPKLIILHMDRSRIASVAAGLPDALDLLVICAGAGLALEDGIERVGQELRLSHPALADELLLTSADLKVLSTSEEALAKLVERINLPTVRSLVTTLSQTMRYGTPLAQALRVIAAGMRSDALLLMEERANKLPALMTVPMIVLIMPTVFLIVGGPVVLRIIDLMAK